IAKLKRPFGCEVQTALCFVHRSQEQARTGMTDPRVGHSKVNRRLPQWQLPSIFSQEPGTAITPATIRYLIVTKIARGPTLTRPHVLECFELHGGVRNVCYWPKAHMSKNAIDVAIGGKADMPFCTAYVR